MKEKLAYNNSLKNIIKSKIIAIINKSIEKRKYSYSLSRYKQDYFRMKYPLIVDNGIIISFGKIPFKIEIQIRINRYRCLREIDRLYRNSSIFSG